MRRLVLPLGLIALGLGAGPARAGDPAAEAIARFQEKYTAGLEDLTPEQVDAIRGPLLEPVAAAGTPAAFRAVLGVARERAEQVATFRKRLKEIDEAEKKEKEDAGKGDPAKAPVSDTPVADAAKREAEEKRRKEDRERIPKRLEREDRWQKRLADAAGSLLDALSDADFAKAAQGDVKPILGDDIEGWDAWMAAALGRCRKERTARMLLEIAATALQEYRKALQDRAGPAKELDKVNDEISRRVMDYIVRQQKAGDMSGTYPSNLVPEAMRREQSRLDTLVAQFTAAMQETDIRRRAAREAFGGMLAGAPEDARGRLLDVLEKEALSSKDFDGRSFGIGALGPCPGDRAMKVLREAAQDPAPDVVVAALDALGRRTEAEALEILAADLADPRWQVRAAAAEGLASYGRALGVPPLLAALAKAEGRTVDDLHLALSRLTGQKLAPLGSAWEGWWATAKESFRGPRDPDAPAAPKPGDAAAGGTPAPRGEGVSFYGIETKSERLLFILDFSGSMNFPGSSVDSKKKKIDILHEEMRKTIAGLPDGAKFNMVAFSEDVRVWKKAPAIRDAKVAKEAVDWIEKQKVAGSTNIYDALETGFRLIGGGVARESGYEPIFDTIFFMTDGKPTSGKVTDTGLIRGDVRRWNGTKKVRVHVIGMGGKDKGGRGPQADDIDRDFLQKLATESQGDCVFR